MEVNRMQYPHEVKTNSDPDEKIYYSDLQVCQSGAGYYVGRMGWVVDKKLGEYPEPYSRESEYYPTREAAEQALKARNFDRESGVENEFARSIGNLPPKGE